MICAQHKAPYRMKKNQFIFIGISSFSWKVIDFHANDASGKTLFIFFHSEYIYFYVKKQLIQNLLLLKKFLNFIFDHISGGFTTFATSARFR